eukprot:Gb_17500 [translate_table: standard]
MLLGAPTRVLQIVKKESGGLLWKKIKLNHTRKANAKKRLQRVWQNEAVLRACAGPTPEGSSSSLESNKTNRDGREPESK